MALAIQFTKGPRTYYQNSRSGNGTGPIAIYRVHNGASVDDYYEVVRIINEQYPPDFNSGAQLRRFNRLKGDCIRQYNRWVAGHFGSPYR